MSFFVEFIQWANNAFCSVCLAGLLSTNSIAASPSHLHPSFIVIAPNPCSAPTLVYRPSCSPPYS